MFNITDIRRMQKNRPDLTDDQSSEVLGFLNDVYAIESFDIKDTDKLFKEAADYIYPKLLVSA